ncbi:hypothetical protein OEZ85_000154 [Tetradesmus obliquus]|uniref:dihydrolipoyllysine-residue succinyltransferase n=1 Tax=Tetradesmus obliquus TaxID=3088 RepID=A0ABY8UPM8_TETOB|nr:hypothetical protein OEZ85_000154 [Tetradesmus obliquus]
MALRNARRLVQKGGRALQQLQAASASEAASQQLICPLGQAVARQSLWTGLSQHGQNAGAAAVQAALPRLQSSSQRSLVRSLQTSAPAAAEVVVPAMGDSITEGSIAAVLKQPGDTVQEDDVIAQIETDKVTIDVKFTGKSGRISTLLVAEGDTVVVGQAVASVEEGAFGSSSSSSAPAAAAEEEAPAAAAAAPPKPAAAAAAAAPPKPAAAAPPPPPKAAVQQQAPAGAAGGGEAAPPPSRGDRPERRVKMTRLRLRVAERLKGAQNTYAMLTTFNEVDMSGLMEMRNAYKDVFLEKHGVKLGFMSAFVKAAAAALQEVPAVNAVIDGSDIIYRDYTDISIAVATPKGLVVPVLRSVDKLSFAEVEKNINALGRKARDGSISIDDMAGGTFTISNGGVYGSMLSTPIINPPQSAILGMHNITPRAMVVGKGIEARPMMYIALTYDHRLIDGREAVTFLKRVKEVVEDPRRLLLSV